MKNFLIVLGLLIIWTFSGAQKKPKIEWIEIPAGEFMMGSPATELGKSGMEIQHQVTLSAFRMSKYEITVTQFKAFVEATGYVTDAEKGTFGYKGSFIFKDGKWEQKTDANWKYGSTGNLLDEKDYNQPVVHVSWTDATAFASWMGCRLPTEAEWEYSCRAGSTTPFNTGENLTTDQANYDGNIPYGKNEKGEFRGKSLKVGSFKPNEFGLSDMHGNVCEWCNDWYANYTPADSINPAGPEKGNYRIYRGGSWCSKAEYCRSAYRIYNNIAFRRADLGFRLASVKGKSN
jgi:formylglycine-generating enzyme